MGVTDRLDRYQRRHHWAAFPLAVLYKFVDDQGTYLAALITYYGFLSLFPLLLLSASVLGFVLQDDPELQSEILRSALRQFPVLGDELRDPQGLRGSVVGVVVGALVALYGALGVAQAVQNAMNVVWAVPRHRRPNPIKARARSLLLLGTGGIGVLGTTVLSAITASSKAYGGSVSRSVAVVAAIAAIALNASVFVLAFRVATARDLRKRDVLPGALGAAVVWQLLQVFGAAYVRSVLNGPSATYGTFALVLGLLAWLFVAAVAVVLCVEVNVVRAKRLYPRALLTPFTDDVDLTGADERTYADAATAQSAKGFEQVEVRFDREGDTRPGSTAGDARPGSTAGDARPGSTAGDAGRLTPGTPPPPSP